MYDFPDLHKFPWSEIWCKTCKWFWVVSPPPPPRNDFFEFSCRFFLIEWYFKSDHVVIADN